MPLYLKVWNWSNTAEITDKPTKLLTANVAISAVVIGTNLWLHLFLLFAVFFVTYIVILIAGHQIVCVNLCRLHLSVFLRPSLCTRRPTSVLESSCHSKGRGFPGRHHHHSTPLLNRPQKITPAFQPQQQQPIGFGQVGARTHVLHNHKRIHTKARKHTQLFIFHLFGIVDNRETLGTLGPIDQAEYAV